MRHDPLTSLIRLRRIACDEAQRALAACTDAAAASGAVAMEADLSITREERAAGRIDGDDGLVEAFAAWLPGARKRAGEARAAHERSQADADRARAVLAASRSALEAIETLVARRQAAQASLATKQQQAELEDLGRGAPPW